MLVLTAWDSFGIQSAGLNLRQERLKGVFGKTKVLTKHQSFICTFQTLWIESIVCQFSRINREATGNIPELHGF